MSSNAQLLPRKPSSKAENTRRKQRASSVSSRQSLAPLPIAINTRTLVPLRTPFTLYSSMLYQLDTSSTTALATGAEITMNLNALALPYPSDNTVQPYGFDQLAQFYRRAKVNTVDLDITVSTFVATNVSHGTIAYMQYRPPASTSTIAGITLAFQRLGDRTNCDYIALQSSTAQGIKRYRKHIDIGKLSGLTKAELTANVEDFASGMTSGDVPSKVCKLAFSVSSDTISAITHNFYIRAAYNGEAYERVDFTES